MNYIKEINSFYDWLETNSLSNPAIALWHALMQINNRAGWITEFAVAISTLETKTGLKRGAIFNARLRLQQTGRIDFKSRNGQQSAIYQIIPFEQCVHLMDTNRNTNTTQTGTQTGTQTRHKPELLFKQNETKRNKELNNPPLSPKGERFTPPILEAVIAYCEERQNNVDAGKWFDFYSSKGWMVGRNKMKDWKAAVRTWEKNDFKPQSQYQRTKDKLNQLYQEAVADEQAGNY